MNNLKNWTVKDSFFHPLGLFNNASRSKTVFVAWGHNTLFTYIFKKSGGSNTLKDSFKILLQGTIQQIVATEFNTLCLTIAGYVYYFSSCKSLKRLEFLDGVRCMIETEKGFALIKVTKENRIFLETYHDFTESSRIGQGRRSYDISFDDNNLLNSSWMHEKFCIHFIAIAEGNKQFLGLIAKQPVSGAQFFLFTINNNLFGLIADPSKDTDECVVFLIHTLPSDIESIFFVKETNIILIFMKCGVLEMIFYSNLCKSLDRAVHVIDADMGSFTMAENCFYYSDCQRIVKCSFLYDDIKHTISVKKIEKKIGGIIALTWVSTMRKLICLNENNIFYRVKFDESEARSGRDSDEEFSELKEEKIKEVEAHFRAVFDLMEEPNRIRKQVTMECYKQEVISVLSRKNAYEKVVKAKINFVNHLPSLEGIVVYPNMGQVLTKNTFFALIKIEVESNRIFRTGLWKVCCELMDARYVCKSILVNNTLIQNPITIVLQMERNNILTIPEVNVALTSYARVGDEFIYVSIPAQISICNINELFSPHLRTLVDPNFETVEEKISAHTKNKDLLGLQNKFSTRIRTPLLMSLNEIHEMFSYRTANNENNLNSKFIVYLLGIEITIEYFETENQIEIHCKDPGALFYAKRNIAKRLFSDLHNNETETHKNDLLSLQKLKAELDSKNDSNIESKTLTTFLAKFYWNLRNGVSTKL